MKCKLYLLLTGVVIMANSFANETAQANKKEKKYESIIQKNNIDLALGASTGIGAICSGSYVYQLIEQMGLHKSKYYIMASVGTLGSGLATIIFYGGGEKLRNKLHEFLNKQEQTNTNDLDFNTDTINYYYETAFILAYLGMITGHIASELILTTDLLKLR